MKHKPRTIVVDWLNTIWKTDLPPHAKYLACYLRKFMNSQQDIAWPSYATIMGETGLGRATVAKYLECLELEGWIHRDRGTGVSTTYMATFPKNVQEAANKASKMIESSSGDELVREANGSGGEPSSSRGEHQLVREANTNKQSNKQISKQGVSKATRLPVDWFVTQEYYKAAKILKPEWHDGDIKLCADTFRDYWIAKSGKDATKTDWLATWRNWIRNQRGNYGQNRPAGRRESLSERSSRQSAEILAKLEAEEADQRLMGEDGSALRPQVVQPRRASHDGERSVFDGVYSVVSEDRGVDR